MKRTMWIVGLVLICTLGQAAAGLPDGTFAGTGVWRAMDGSSGEYSSRVIFDDDRITIEAEFEREGAARTERHTMTLLSKSEGFFELFDEKGDAIGQLVCLDDECSYNVRQDGVAVAETWRVTGGELRKFGTKKIGEFQVVWKETLYSN